MSQRKKFEPSTMFVKNQKSAGKLLNKSRKSSAKPSTSNDGARGLSKGYPSTSATTDADCQTHHTFPPAKNVQMIGYDPRRGDRLLQAPTYFCSICYKNKQYHLCRTHNLKEPNGRITCPVLRSIVCTLCSASGDNAHTLSYCPLYKRK